MEKHGVTLTSTNQLIAELAGSWGTPEGGRIVQEVLMDALQAESESTSALARIAGRWRSWTGA